MDNSPLDEEAIFHTARKIDNPEARAEYLAQICAGDIRLRERVEALLRVVEEDGEFLQPAVAQPESTVGDAVPEPPSRIIGRYKVLQQIGRGGFGVVYMAEQERPIRRKVALKLSFPGRDSRQVIARFEAERQALSLMEHPNIARVFDAGATDDGLPYFVMELVRGEPITKYCDDRKLSPRRRLELFLPVCHAIQHAHQKGVIHRDIKPSNILVAEYDERPMAKVIDFGVAKAVSQPLTDKTMFTGFGQILGTLEYMSPEQAKMNQLDIDTRSDIYSLGVVLYELLVGDLPFDRERFRTTSIDEILRIIREEDPPRPSLRLTSSRQLTQNAVKRDIGPQKLRSLVWGELDWIVMKCLEKDRARRYETANGLAKDLQHYLDDEPVLARPPTARYRLGKFARRNKSLVSSVFAIMLALTVGLGMATWQALEKGWALEVADEQRDRARQFARSEATAREESEKRLYLADMVRAWDSWKIGNLNEAERLLELHRPKPGETDRRGVEWNLLAAELEVPERIQSFTTSGLPINMVATADGKWIAVSQLDGKVVLYSVTDGSVRTIPTAEPSVHILPPLSAGPSGAVILLGGTTRGKLRIYDVSNEEETFLEIDGHVTAASFDSQASRQRIAVAHTTSTLRHASIKISHVTLYDLTEELVVRTWTLETAGISRLAWSLDGHTLAVACHDGYVFVLDPESMTIKREIKVGYPVHDICFVEDDSILASVGISHAGHEIQLWNIETSALSGVLPGHDGLVMGVARLANGDLASCGRDNMIRIWDVGNRREKRRLRGHSHYVSAIAAAGTRDDVMIVSAGYDFQVARWSLSPTTRVREVRTKADGQVHEIVITTDDRQFASGSPSGSIVEIRDLHSGDPIKTLDCPGPVWGLAIDDNDNIKVGCEDGGVVYVDIAGGHHREEMRVEFEARAFDLSSTGRYTAIGGQGHQYLASELVVVVDNSDNQRIAELHVSEGAVLGLAWSPDESLLAASGAHGIRVWRSDTWKVLYDRQHEGLEVPDVAFSPDGKLLSSGGWDGTVRFWDPTTGAPLGAPLFGHAGFIWELRFSPDGKTLFTTSGDETLGVWDVESRELRARIPDHIGGSKALCVSKSGTWLLTGGLWDNKIHIRRLRPEAEP